MNADARPSRAPETTLRVMQSALRAVSDERPNTHGTADLNFACINDFWQLYDAWLKRMGRVSTPADVATKMELFKIARTLTGDPAELGHYEDRIGYAGLAAHLAQDGTQRVAQNVADAIAAAQNAADAIAAAQKGDVSMGLGRDRFPLRPSVPSKVTAPADPVVPANT